MGDYDRDQDLDTEIVTVSPMGYPITMTLRDALSTDPDQGIDALGLGTASLNNTGDFISSATGSVTPILLAGGFAKHDLVAGAIAGPVTINGIKIGDELNEVLLFTHGDMGVGTAITGISDITNEFVIRADNLIDNTGSTSSLGHKLLVRWTKKTA